MSEVIQTAINRLIDGNDLSRNESMKIMKLIMTGNATDAQISAFLVALRIKGETVEEVAGAVDAVMADSKKISSDIKNIVDTCGTGGDSLHTFNISTAAAFVAAGAGITVAKHGNYSVSSKCGSADVLQALDIKIDMSAEDTEKCLREMGIAFLFAPKYQTSVKYAMGPRREIGARTLLNLLGPLINPALTRRQLIGVYDAHLLRLVVEVMQLLGAVQVMSVHGQEGMDEISISGPTSVCELIDGTIYEYTIKPQDFKIRSAPVKKIQTLQVEENRKILLDVLNGKRSAALDIVLLNAGAAIKVSGKVDSIWEGVDKARESIKTGAALEKLVQMQKFSKRIEKRK